MTKNVTTQYNGMLLLTGYLQRLFVAETIYRNIGEPYEEKRFDQIKALLDETYTIIPVFEETQNLTMAQKEQLQLITQQTEELMHSYFKQLPLSFNQKLAIVGSSLYAEQHINAGIVRLGELFNVEVNTDYHKRVKFYADRTRMIDYLVETLSQKEQPEEQFMKPIDLWFNDVMRNKDFVLNDFKQIEKLLEFA